MMYSKHYVNVKLSNLKQIITPVSSGFMDFSGS